MEAVYPMKDFELQRSLNLKLQNIVFHLIQVYTDRVLCYLLYAVGTANWKSQLIIPEYIGQGSSTQLELTDDCSCAGIKWGYYRPLVAPSLSARKSLILG